MPASNVFFFWGCCLLARDLHSVGVYIGKGRELLGVGSMQIGVLEGGPGECAHRAKVWLLLRWMG